MFDSPILPITSFHSTNRADGRSLTPPIPTITSPPPYTSQSTIPPVLKRLLRPYPLRNLINVPASLELSFELRSINRSVLHSPRLRSTKMRQQPQNPTIQSLLDLNQTASSCILIQLVLWPASDWKLGVTFVYVDEAGGGDARAHRRIHIARITGFLGASEHGGVVVCD